MTTQMEMATVGLAAFLSGALMAAELADDRGVACDPRMAKELAVLSRVLENRLTDVFCLSESAPAIGSGAR